MIIMTLPESSEKKFDDLATHYRSCTKDKCEVCKAVWDAVKIHEDKIRNAGIKVLLAYQ